MKRKALVIVNPGERGEENYCEGVYKDSDHYVSFLRAPYGGLWQETEIKVLERPSSVTVLAEIRLAGQAEYTLIAFSGHGYRSNDQNVLIFRKDEELTANDLVTKAPRQTMILDCCREIVRPLPLTEELRKSVTVPILNDQDCRYYYDNNLLSCPEDLIVLFSCSVGEQSADTNTLGGVYSYSLLRGAERWVSRNDDVDTSKNFCVHTVVKAHIEAAENVKKMRPRQNPDIQKYKSGAYYPFCIIA